MIRFIDRSRDQMVKEIADDIAKSRWSIVACEIDDEIIVGWANATDKIMIIGALSRVIHRLQCDIDRGSNE